MTQRHAKRTRRSGGASGSEADAGPLVREALVTREEFSAAFDRCFARVYAYVGRRVNDAKSCERVVSEVLAENLDLLVDGGDGRQEVIQLKASSDRLIELASVRSRSRRAIRP